MRVLVTGHHGYIGAVMTHVLREVGHQVVGLDTFYYEDCTLGRDDEKVEAIRKDVRDVTPKDLAGFEAVVHLAALSNDPLGELKADWTEDINFRGSLRLAQAAREAGVKRYLFSSSCSMYGAAGDDVLAEDAPLRPLTSYAASKVRTEAEVSRLASRDFSPVFMRNATAYGVSPRLRADIVLNNLVGWAFTTGKVKIMSDGSPWRPIVHIEDISRAFVVALTAPREKIHNQAFNIGANGENYRVRDLAEIVLQTVPGSKVEYAGQGGPDPRNYRVDFSRFARAFPDFAPKWNARLGAQELYAAFQKVGLTKEEFLGRKFVRLTQLKHLLAQSLLDDSLRWR
jgi:nucleoside-diphosphate-sugar epimerase